MTTTREFNAIRRDIDALAKKQRALVTDCIAKRDAIRRTIAASQARIAETLGR